MPVTRRPQIRRFASSRGIRRRGTTIVLDDPAMGRSSRGGHLLTANWARGLSPRQALVARSAVFAAMPKTHPAKDKPQFMQGTRGGKRK